MNKKVFIIGKGSIGLRQSQILKKIGYKVIFVRRKIRNEKNEINFSEIKKENINFFIICNPTALHEETLKKLIKYNKPILVEKPLFHKTNNKLIKTIKNKELIFTAYQMRFDPRIVKLKKMINNKKNLVSYLSWQTYMPNWHKKENYINSYVSIKELGGGAILTLSHEIDLAIYLFGKIKKIHIFKLNNNLNINVEDKILILFKHISGSISNLYLNFGSINLERNIKIFSNKNIYKWDFYKKYLTVKEKNISKKIFFNFKNNDIYNYQLKDFLKHLKSKKYSKSKINFKNTFYTQQILDKIKEEYKKI